MKEEIFALVEKKVEFHDIIVRDFRFRVLYFMSCLQTVLFNLSKFLFQARIAVVEIQVALL